MTTITTKFSVGDTVYRAWTITTQKQHPCPDCLDTRKWLAKSPAGQEFGFACPRCGPGYKSDCDLSLSYTAHEPTVEKLTIGSVRLDTNNKENPVDYMCVETGVGSGSIHREEYLHPSKDAAQEHSQLLAVERNNSVGWIVEQYNKSLSISDYQLIDAKMKAADDRDRTRRVRVSMLFDDLKGCETIDAVRERIERFE